jgi:hypothetical protein
MYQRRDLHGSENKLRVDDGYRGQFEGTAWHSNGETSIIYIQ